MLEKLFPDRAKWSVSEWLKRRTTEFAMMCHRALQTHTLSLSLSNNQDTYSSSNCEFASDRLFTAEFLSGNCPQLKGATSLKTHPFIHLLPRAAYWWAHAELLQLPQDQKVQNSWHTCFNSGQLWRAIVNWELTVKLAKLLLTTWPRFHFLLCPTSFPWSLIGYRFWEHSAINHIHINLCLRVCPLENPTWKSQGARGHMRRNQCVNSLDFI